MRIAIVSTPFAAVPPRGYGGTELVVHHLARGLTRAGHDVVLFATGDSEGHDVRWIYASPEWPPNQGADLRHSRAAARAIAGERFDVVHAHTPAFLVAAGRQLGAPIIYTIHHAREDHLVELYAARPDVQYVAISRRQADLLPELPCTVVHHGIDVAATGRGGTGDYVLFLGRLSPCKGPDLAVRSAADARMQLVVAGTFHEEPDTPRGWRERMTTLLEQPHVRAIGAVAGDYKDRLIECARALIAPIRWEEPFGLTLIEAMLRGTPVVTTARGAAPEIVDDGVTGVLVDDDAALPDALRRAVRLDRAACRRRARLRFGASRMVEAYTRVYRDVQARARQPADVGYEQRGA